MEYKVCLWITLHYLTYAVHEPVLLRNCGQIPPLLQSCLWAVKEDGLALSTSSPKSWLIWVEISHFLLFSLVGGTQAKGCRQASYKLFYENLFLVSGVNKWKPMATIPIGNNHILCKTCLRLTVFICLLLISKCLFMAQIFKKKCFTIF